MKSDKYSTQKTLANDSKNPKITTLIRSNFCGQLANIFSHAFISGGFRFFFGNNHMWNFIEDASRSSDVPQMKLLPLTKAFHDIDEIPALKDDKNKKFRSWICAGLK